jgi:hypothetical protein
MRNTVSAGVTSGREVETRVRLQEERIREVREMVDEVVIWTRDTEQYITFYEPIRVMN